MRLKFPRAALESSYAIVNSLEPGTMLAAKPLSWIIPLISSQFLQGDHRGMATVQLSRFGGKPEKGRQRALAHRFVSGLSTNTEAYDAFVEELQLSFRYVVIDTDVAAQERVLQALTKAGFKANEVNGASFVKGDRKVRRGAGEKCGTLDTDNSSHRMSQILHC